MNCFDFLEAIEAAKGPIKKLALLEQGKKLEDDQLSFLFERTFNYKRRYYIKKLPDGLVSPMSPQNIDARLDDFKGLLDECEVSGRTQETKQKVANWLASQPALVGKWCKRVLLRDLKANLDSALPLKAGFEFPTFEVQLATDGQKCKKLDKMVKKGMFKAPKLNGYRCFAIKRGDQVDLFSRNGNPLPNFPMVEQAILERFADFGDFCLDGEIMSDSFNAMQQSAFAAKRKTVVGDVYYAIFGMVSIDEWDAQVFKETYRSRRQNLINLFEQTELHAAEAKITCLRHVKSEEVPDTWTLADWMDYVRECVALGFEGAIGYPADEPYYMGRKSNAMLKFKFMLSMDCLVIGANPGKLGGKREGVLGSFIVKQENGEKCDVGSGFKDDELPALWERRDEIINFWVLEVAYQELTPDGIMLFPVYKRRRTDKE